MCYTGDSQMTKHYDSWDDITRDYTEEQLIQAYNDAGVINWQRLHRGEFARKQHPLPHGHMLHHCLSSRCLPPTDWQFRQGCRVRPDIDIAVVWDTEMDAYLALQDPDEIWTANVAENRNEEVCHYLAICELLNQHVLAEFPPKGKYSEQLQLSVVMYQGGLGGQFARVAFHHDLDDVISAIDMPGGMLS
jgi:hypothetical protein